MIAEMDCEPEKNKKICKSFKVTGYPALIFFKDGKKFEKYIGERKLEELKIYVDDFLREDDELKKKKEAE
jgi:thioredoxin-like negative regulator of GroEL